MNINPLLFYKCLSEETRLKALLLIQQEGELCVCELVESLELSQPKISRHLAQLRECGILSDRRVGQWVYYRMNPNLPEWCVSVLTLTRQENKSFIQNELSLLCCMDDRPQVKSFLQK